MTSKILKSAQIIDLLKDRLRVWRTPEGDLYADVLYGGKWRPILLSRNVVFRGLLLSLLKEKGFEWPGRDTMDELAAYYETLAASSGNVEMAHLRVAEKNGALYYNVGEESGVCVKFQGGKWEYVHDDVPKFVSGQGMLSQVLARDDKGRLPDLLKPFIVARDDREMALIIAWLIGCFKPGGPFPVLVINGEQGSAKSTTTKVLRRLIDPHTRPMRGPPKDDRDLAVALKHGYIAAFDNVSKISSELSDTLCTIAYGDRAIGGRALYTNYGDAAFTAVRPVMLNGITDFVLRGDLMERSLVLHLPQIMRKDRVDDDTFWAGFEEALPGILGALYDAVAAAHLNFQYTVIPSDMRIRMANFCRWAVAAEPATNYSEGTILKALDKNDKQNAYMLLEYDPVGMAVADFMENRTVYHGDLQQLNNELVPFRDGSKGYWPETPRALSSALKMIKGHLRRFGIDAYENGHNVKTRRAMWELRKVAKSE